MPTNVHNKLFVQLVNEVRREIKNSKKSYAEIIEQEFLNKTGKSRFPDDNFFKERFKLYELYNAKSSMRKYILERLENYNNKEQVAVYEQLENQTLTIEHIMPQTLTEKWKKDLGSNWEFIYTKYKDTIGNLTLTGYNSSYSNNTFKVKKYMKEIGFNASRLKLNSYLKDCDSWGEEEIKERAEELFNDAIKIWWRPKKVNNLNLEYSENMILSLEDDIDLSSKEIKEIKIKDFILKIDSMTNLTKEFHKYFYTEYSVEYHKNKFKWFSNDKSIFKKPYKLDNAAYIESYKNPVQQLETIKDIVKVIGIEFSEVELKVTKIKDKRTVGQLAFDIFKELLNNGMMTDEEIENFKTLKYTKKFFCHQYYPVFSNTRDAHMRNSTKYRYRKNPIKYKDMEIFVTTEWYKEDREDLLKWYNEKNLRLDK